MSSEDVRSNLACLAANQEPPPIITESLPAGESRSLTKIRIVVGAIVVWFVSYIVMFLFADFVGMWAYPAWVAVKASLPLVAAVCMYALDIRQGTLRGLSNLRIHLTYPCAIAVMWSPLRAGMEMSVTPTDAGVEAVAVDLMCFMSALAGCAVFFSIWGVAHVTNSFRVWLRRG